MPSKTDDFGIVSNGLDRAEIDASPPLDASGTFRPDVEAAVYRRTSIRGTIGDSFPNILVHPQHGMRRIKRAIKDKKAESDEVEEHPKLAPVLAPVPPLGSGEERLIAHPNDEETKLPNIQAIVHHPVTTLKSIARDQGGGEFAAAIAKSEVSHSADVRLLRQQDSVNDAPEHQVEAEKKTYIQHKHARQDAFVRWSIDRHVRRVAVPPEPIPPGPWPPTSASWEEWKLLGSKKIIYGLEKYGEHYIDLSPEWSEPTQALMSSGVERVVVASTPLQSLFVRLRDISHWKNPQQSAAWMVLYFVCLFYSQITRMAILLMMFSVLYRRWHPPTIEEMQVSITAAEDKTVKAHTLTELIIKYGTKGWGDEIIKQAGPVLQYNIEQTAATLERLQNFYEWRNPYRTKVTLGLLLAFWALLTITPTWLLVQMNFFAMGITFFILEPIVDRYPRYRLLTSPFTFLFWKIPTHAEWAIARLQAEGAQYKSPPDAEKDPLIIGYFNYEGAVPGKLTLTTNSIRCSPDTSKKADWQLLFSDLESMHKISEQTRTKDLESLLLISKSGERYHLAGLAQRDEVFSQILGYSGVSWKRIE